MNYSTMTKQQLAEELRKLREKYEEAKLLGLKLDMSRGIQDKDQLDLTQEMLTILHGGSDCISENGIDCRNYGLLDGLPEVKNIFSDILEVPAQNIIVCGNSSLNIMYDTVARAMLYGVGDGYEPWFGRKIKFLCPVPGYDRHFAICESLGIEMVNIPMTSEGPDMDMVEKLVSEDDSVKGMWCVPKYSNPSGIVYSDRVINRIASMKPAAGDFRIFWDNAYVVHSLYGLPAKQLNFFEELKKYGNDDMAYIFASTSKISYPGAGVAVIASSDRNIAYIKNIMKIQIIGHDKLNQLRHARYFGSYEGILRHMEKHAAILRPKFDCVEETFEKEFSGLGIAEWSKPEGGYFVSLNLQNGCAARTYELLADIGVKITPAGSPLPYGKDPNDSNLRIAPTFPPLSELKTALNMLCLCAKIACAEKICSERE
ncbi:MAG: aminotransferase class I/II-fold pyridoxal phosphate-dependent enzyme [Firmicutes bacterium]|nr:aminotransferase class I/II-fold pyridoxal phosphate-dependent enzyme [Bacillota bacterium]